MEAVTSDENGHITLRQPGTTTKKEKEKKL